MAIYEYYCPTCREKFEERRSMAQATTPATCRSGHRAERTLSAFATPRSGGAGTAVAMDEAGSGGGCCGGGGCGCGSSLN